MKKLALLLVPVVTALGTMACEDDPGSNWIPDISIDTVVDTAGDPSTDTTMPDPTADPIPDPTSEVPDTIADTSVDEIPSGVYGTLNISFNSTYIFDYDLLVADTTGAYLSAHMGGVVMGGAYTGTYGSGGVIPPAGAAQTIALAAHAPAEGTYPAYVLTLQQSQSSTAVMNPMVQMYFPNDTITAGSYALDIQTAADIMLVVLNSTGPSSACALAVAIGGTLTVTNAVNTTAEGGSLAFNGSAVSIYHPTATPLGDVSSAFTSAGLTICPIE